MEFSRAANLTSGKFTQVNVHGAVTATKRMISILGLQLKSSPPYWMTGKKILISFFCFAIQHGRHAFVNYTLLVYEYKSTSVLSQILQSDQWLRCSPL